MDKGQCLLGGLVLLSAGGCATQAQVASLAALPPIVDVPWHSNPYPSTYHPFPGVPTLITHVTVYDGEGARIDGGEVLFADTRIAAVGHALVPPPGATVIDGQGMWVTPGIIDVHSHLGVGPSPDVAANDDTNEVTSPVTADVWAEHSIWPQDPGFSRALTNGGVTTLQLLPGSANLFGGRSVVVKNVYARTAQGMKFPDAPYGLKMACGENPKRVWGGHGKEPSTRMGNIAVDRQTWAKAQAYRRKWVKYLKTKSGDPPDQDIALDTLAAVLEGSIRVHNHCYRADEMANVMDMSVEFRYHVTAFHHAVEAYKIADLLRARNVCAVVWADWYGFKLEANDAIPENLALLERAGACAMIHSDDEYGIQHLNQEVAKALAAGRRVGIELSDEQAWRWLSYNPAKALGIEDRTGSLKPGKMADVVLWNGDPFSVYTRPQMVWIDGALLFDARDPKKRPVSDFELGLPGAGDVK